MKFVKLSGSDAFASPLLLATFPTLTEVHLVPEGETHLVSLSAINTDNTNPHEVLGDLGDGVNTINHDVPAETTVEILRDVAIVGPGALSLGKVTGSLRVMGHAKVLP